MKILHMMGGGDVGGAKTHIMTLIQALRENNEVTLISFRDGPFPQEAAKKGIPVVVIPRYNPFVCNHAVCKVIRDFQPDVIHCHGGRANMMGALARLCSHVPVLTTVHSDYRLDYMGNPLKQHTLGLVNTISLRFLDFHQGVADRMARTLIHRGFHPEKVFKIYNGMDFGDSITGLDRTAYCKTEWGIDVADTDVLCGIAARLTAVKDIATCVRGFAHALEHNPNMRLLIAGDGEDEKMLRNLATQLGAIHRIHFCGWVTDVRSFFACLDIDLLTSVSETFPYSILEGVREHCAIICSDVGGMGELIDTGENGYIFPVRDHETLGKQLLTLSLDAEKRKNFADLLYDKAVREYSLRTMCHTQENNYRSLLDRYHNPKKKIVICGAYGKGNAGDDAILQGIVQEMRSLDNNRPIVVMSRRPAETKLLYRTGAVYTFDILRVLWHFRKAALYINGGGSLMQDVTSTRSLKYYLFTLSQAKQRGCKVMMYGCGIGPINRPANIRHTAQVINRSVDLITLRDDLSKGALQEMGIQGPEVRLAADPTIILTPASTALVEDTLDNLGIPTGVQYLGFGLRNWKGLASVADQIVASAEYAYEKHGVIPLFVPIEFPKDLEPAQTIASRLNCPYYIIDARLPIEVTIGILSRCKTVVGIRLHSLMFSAGQGVPVIGMSYDIKVDGFLRYISADTCINLAEVRSEQLNGLIDRCMSGEMHEQVRATAKLLLDREHENKAGAKRLLAEYENM